MSKAVTLVTNPIELSSGEYLSLGSDGQVYHVNDAMEKGYELEPGAAPVVTKKALVSIKRAIPVIIKSKKLIDSTSKIKADLRNLARKIESGSLGSVRFVGDNGSEDDHEDIGIGIGCTFLDVDEFPSVMKKLGIR